MLIIIIDMEETITMIAAIMVIVTVETMIIRRILNMLKNLQE